MARPLRISYPGAVYHVSARGNERKPIARDDRDRQRFVDTLASMVEQYHVVCHAWVLMSNHYHLLLETPHANLSRAIRHLNGVYTQAFNRRHHRVGHLFQGRFKAIVVEKDAYLLELCRYVVLNPVRAQVVNHPRRWGWSSYRATAGEDPAPPWLTVDWVMGQFAPRRATAQTTYRRFVEAGIREAERPWSQVRGQIYLGSDTFLTAVHRQIKRHADPEIPRAQKAPARPRLDELLARAAGAYKTSVPTLVRPTRRPSDARQVALFAARRLAGLDLKAIATRFGLSYTGVSRRVSEVGKRLAEDSALRTKLAQVRNVKVKT
jgi:REP element-mobilizing transposase RayT